MMQQQTVFDNDLTAFPDMMTEMLESIKLTSIMTRMLETLSHDLWNCKVQAHGDGWRFILQLVELACLQKCDTSSDTFLFRFSCDLVSLSEHR